MRWPIRRCREPGHAAYGSAGLGRWESGGVTSATPRSATDRGRVGGRRHATKAYCPEGPQHPEERSVMVGPAAGPARAGRLEVSEGWRELGARGGRVTGARRGQCCRLASEVSSGRTAMTIFPVACVAALFLLTHWSLAFSVVPPEQAGSGHTSWSWPLDEAKLPRRVVKSKKKEISLYHHTCLDVFFLVLFTFDALVEPVYSPWWVGGIECAR